MTIKEAARTILQTSGAPMAAVEIAQRIQERGLFSFKVTQPRQVVLATLKRHSINSHSCMPSKQPCFRELSGPVFELISIK
jgi:hypothetical protein